MTDATTLDAYGTLTEPATLTIQRFLPGPAERIWSYLTDSDLRRQWLAAGDMQGAAGTKFEFVWRNDELSNPPGQRPEGFPEEHRLTSEITEFDPPKRLSITWGSTGGVTFTLEPKGARVLLTVIHRRLPDRGTMLNVSAGWHQHLDTLVARLEGREPGAFWAGWNSLKAEYDRRLP